MRLRLLLLVPVLSLLTAAGVRGEADYIDNAALYSAGLVKFWQLPLPLREGQELAAAFLVDDAVYLATRDGDVYAVHAHTGALRWTTQVTSAGYPIRRPCHAEDRTIFVLPSMILQYDRYTGRPIRKVDLGFPAGSPAASDGTRIYVGGIDQRIYAFPLDQDFDSWKARADGQVVSRPVLSGEYLYFASDDGTVYACTAANKKYYWRTRVYGSITADLAVDKLNLYVPTLDNSLIALDPSLGGRRWRTRFSGPLYEPPVATPEVAFQYCQADGLSAINTQTVGVEKRVRWVMPRGRQLLTADDELAYVLTLDETIAVARLEDGRLVHTIPAAGFTMPIPSPADPALYLAAKDGRVFCARKPGVPVVRAEEVRRAMEPSAEGQAEAEKRAEEAEETAAEEDHLATKRPGPPIGGKSKVSKEYTGD